MACYGIFWSGQLLNSVIAKYRDLSLSHVIIDLLATDKSRYFAQPHPIIANYLRVPFSLSVSFSLPSCSCKIRCTMYIVSTQRIISNHQSQHISENKCTIYKTDQYGLKYM